MKVLVLAPHADDAELGCGGTIARLVREKHSVKEVFFSCASKDVPKDLKNDIRIHESIQSARLLGMDVDIPEFDDEKTHRNFHLYRQNILEEIIKVKKRFNPDMALIPCSADIHQDHHVVYEEGVRGLKGVKTILSYDTPWNHMINGNYFVPLSMGDVAKKVDAIACYESIQHKPYANPDFIWSWARFRGLQAGSEYAEVFEMIRGEL